MNIYILDNNYIQLENEKGEILIKTKSWKKIENKMKEVLEKREREKMFA